MGIQSTRTISRENAISRIQLICYLLDTKNYKDLESNTSEPNYDIQVWVDEHSHLPLKYFDISNYTNTMIGNIMDKPFFRFSMFDNYFIEVFEAPHE